MVVICFDLSKKASLKSIGKFVSTADQYGKSEVIKVLFGLKSDIRDITEEEA